MVTSGPSDHRVAPRRPDAAGELAADRLRLARRDGREVTRSEGGDHEQVADGVGEEHPRRADGGEGDAADGGADHPAGVHLGGVEGDGAGEVLLADEPGSMAL